MSASSCHSYRRRRRGRTSSCRTGDRTRTGLRCSLGPTDRCRTARRSRRNRSSCPSTPAYMWRRSSRSSCCRPCPHRRCRRCRRIRPARSSCRCSSGCNWNCTGRSHTPAPRRSCRSCPRSRRRRSSCPCSSACRTPSRCRPRSTLPRRSYHRSCRSHRRRSSCRRRIPRRWASTESRRGYRTRLPSSCRSTCHNHRGRRSCPGSPAYMPARPRRRPLGATPRRAALPQRTAPRSWRSRRASAAPKGARLRPCEARRNSTLGWGSSQAQGSAAGKVTVARRVEYAFGAASRAPAARVETA